MSDPFVNALSTQDAKGKSVKKIGPKGGGGGGGGDAPIRLIRVAMSLNGAVSRMQDTPRSQVPATSIAVTASESKGGQTELTDPDEHMHDEIRVRRMKQFTQDWTSASKGLFRFKDKEEDEESHEHAYMPQEETKKDLRLLHLILRILLFCNAFLQTPHPHFYSQIQASEPFLTEVGDTIHYSTPILKNSKNLPYHEISNHDIDTYFNE